MAFRRLDKKNEEPESASARRRVTQTRKRAINVRSMEFAEADKKSRGPIGLELRAIPRAKNRLDAVLSALAMFFGILATVCFFLFFLGNRAAAGYVIIACFSAIAFLGAIDSKARQSKGWIAFLAGAALLLALDIFLVIRFR